MGRGSGTAPDAYPRFRHIDGSHSLKRAAPGAFVDYAARRRRDAEVAFFNFPLAREMGLIPRDHSGRLDPALRRTLLDTFALVIINEYDLLRKARFPARDLKPGRYMATRYLQLQHPGRQGRTSGDGRSIWNGQLSWRGVTWDLSSCGTGVTCLCPATAQNKEFYKTGSAHASYGCGTAGLDEGISSLLLSEILHRAGLLTERVLCVLALPKGRAIVVRAARNLLRPSHFLVHLKQNDLPGLRAKVDLFIDRQIANGDWPRLRGPQRRYDFFARELARVFARVTATFESEYIFCWLDWDGDNILVDGGIIDYGSVRQFGLYHREYRFDDGPRWSTTLPEQRRKARHLVQNFAQIRDFLLTGERPALTSLGRDRVLRLFDAQFAATKRELLLRRIGFDPAAADLLQRRDAKQIERLEKALGYFERARSARGPVAVPDGLSWDAIFSVRDLLRELPGRYRERAEPVAPEDFIEIAASSYAKRRDRALTPQRRRMASQFQRAYLHLVARAARHTDQTPERVLATLDRRAGTRNRHDRVTGDGIDWVTARLLRERRKLSSAVFHRVIEQFIASQDPTRSNAGDEIPGSVGARKLLHALRRYLHEFRHGL